ncbi:hypothetical protein EV646_102307 [Kribbella antiqua]|uniref:Ig-like domain-containing protein n=1 Tax=Kribbella antiqua TaxID=2512217 RepID=A0A4R2IWR4_9ACTN|nr:FlgD immunoglobulin-like domain containing protein [Kribbella antiqua]TCO50233.1 hypothetical protein EV646_102307 [Kribbella antiqua]
MAGRGRRWLGAAAGVVVALAVGLVVIAPAGQAQTLADPAGTVSVNRIPSLMPRITILGASSAGMLYSVERPPYEGAYKFTYLKPAGGAPYEVSSDFRFLAGDKAYAPFNPDGKIRYLTVGSTTVRRCDDAPQPATSFRSAQGAAFTSFGWLSEDGQRVAADATGCRVIGQAPGIGTYTLAAADQTGYVVVANEASDGSLTLEYRSYAAPDQPQVIQTGGRSRYAQGFDLAGAVVTWAQLAYDEPGIKSSYVVRSSTTGGPATVSRVDDFRVHTTAIAGAATGWAGCDDMWTQCRAGTIGAGSALDGSVSVASDGSRFLVDTYGASPGIDAMQVVASGQPRTRIATVGLLPPETRNVAIGASTVAYVDNQGQVGEAPRLTLSRRTFTKSGTAFSLAAQKTVAEVGDSRIARDGRRTAYVDKGGDLWLITDDGVKTRMFDGQAKVAVVQRLNSLPFRLSGSRFLWVKGLYTGVNCDPGICWDTYDNLRLMLFDVRTGLNTDLGAFAGDRPAALWGSYLVYADSSNRIYRKDLSSGAVVQVKGVGTPRVVGLDVNGSIVGWATCTGNDNYGNCATSKIGYRIMTGSAVVERASQHTGSIRLTSGYLFHDTQQTLDDPRVLRAWRLGTSTVTAIGPTDTPYDAFDESVAWSGLDRIAKLTPVAAFTARPRYLGNALGSATLTPNGDGKSDQWTPEFAISKALPTCKITITSGATVKRTLSCATTVGAARVAWNGRDSAGRLVPKGRYTWTLTGSDADGSLLWWTGSATPIRGTVTVA